MRRAASLLVLLSCCLPVSLSPSSRGQDTCTIRIKEPGKGDVRRCDISQSTQTTHRILTAGGQAQERTAGSAQHSVYRETVLDRAPGARRPGRLRREYEKAVAWTQGKPEVLPYQGRAVLIEGAGGRYRFRVENGEALAGPAARLLEREFNQGDRLDLQRLVLPVQAVQPGQAWRIAMAPLAREWERGTTMRVDAARSSGTGRLTKVYRSGGRLFGVLAVRLEMPVLSAGADRPLRMEAGSKVVLDATLDCCIDGSSSAGTLRASFQVEASATVAGPDGRPVRVVLSSRGTLQQSHTD